ncbi:MAG: hypothetical protein ACRERC_09250 [Candidatus Binatia bacterium]
MIISRIRTLAIASAIAALATVATAAVTPPAGYIYTTQLLSSLTQGCVAAGPGGTFVGIGPSFVANAGSIVLAKESGELRLVVAGFNSISDCAYDADADVLYVTDNADNGDFGIVSFFAAQSGDTVFAIPSASTASGLTAPGHELLPANSIPTAASVAVDAAGDVYVSDAVGTGTGRIVKIVGSTPANLVSGLDLAGGLAINPIGGNLFASEYLPATFENQIRQFTSAGVPVPPVPFAPPSFSLGSLDLAFNRDGRLLASGAFAGDVLSFNTGDSTSVPFVSGLNYANGMTVDPVTGRVQILSATFANQPEDKSLHRFTPISELSPGKGSAKTECLHEAYGLTVVDGAATCTDGAPCDSDGVENDACLFPVGFCLNVADATFPDCIPASDVTAVSLTAKPASAAIADAGARIASALPLSGSSCVFSDGYYLPVTITGAGKKDGKAKVSVKVTNADGDKDTDTLKLVCQPAP